MNKKRRTETVLHGLAALVLLPALALTPAIGSATEALPIMPVHTVSGEQVAASELPLIGDGQWTLVMLWASDCAICKTQYPMIGDFHEQHADGRAKVVGIALDGIESRALVEDAVDRYAIRFPTYVANLLEVADDYTRLTATPLRGTPTYLLFDPDGELVGDNPGPLSEGAVERFMASKETGE